MRCDWLFTDDICVQVSSTAASVIASKSQESDFASVAKNVCQQVAEYNKCLMESLQNNRTAHS